MTSGQGKKVSPLKWWCSQGGGGETGRPLYFSLILFNDLKQALCLQPIGNDNVIGGGIIFATEKMNWA